LKIFIKILNSLVIIIFLNEYYIEKKDDSKYNINSKLNYSVFLIFARERNYHNIYYLRLK